MKEDSQPIAREMRPELEAHSIWSLPPTLILFTILVADRTLRARFEADVPGVLVEFGMKSPKHLVGLSERLCPVMPRIPTDVEVAEDIRHPFWEKWLDGAIPQLNNFGERARPLPDRKEISAEDWNWLITHAKRIIEEKSAIIELKKEKARKPRRKPPAERSFHLINVSLPKCGSAWLTSLFGNFRAAHEFQHEMTNTKILNWRNELISDEELVSFIRSRDGIRLDVDSCTSMHLIAGSLADWFPEAKFFYSHRKFSQWATSWIAMLHQESTRASLDGSQGLPSWWKRYARLLVKGLDLHDLEHLEDLPSVVKHLTPALAACWGEAAVRVLTSIPPDRLLALESNRLDESHQTIADFVGVPVGKLLVVEDADRNSGSFSKTLRSMIDLEELETAAEPWTTRCHELMAIHASASQTRGR